TAFRAGGHAENTAQGLAALRPKQDGIVQLAAAGKMSPDDAAQKFFGQQGIQRGHPAEVTVNGQRVPASYFAAQTQQGQVAGLIAFVAYNGTTYALVGYTSAQTLQQVDSIIKSFMGSFAPL